MKKYSFLLLLGLGISLSAQAETPLVTLSQIEGVVLVNQGKQFTRAHNGMSLGAGDRILTMKGAQVALRSDVYGCSSRLQGNDLLTITENLNCETLTRLEANPEPQRYAALGDPAPAGNAATEGSTAAGAGTGTGAGVGTGVGAGLSAEGAWLIGGAALGILAGTGGILESTSGEEPSISVQ